MNRRHRASILVRWAFKPRLWVGRKRLSRKAIVSRAGGEEACMGGGRHQPVTIAYEWLDVGPDSRHSPEAPAQETAAGR